MTMQQHPVPHKPQRQMVATENWQTYYETSITIW